MTAARRGISPGIVFLAVALIGSVLFALYAVTVRDASQIPLLAAGSAVLGIVFIALAIYALRSIWRAGIDGPERAGAGARGRWRDRGHHRRRLRGRRDHPVPAVPDAHGLGAAGKRPRPDPLVDSGRPVPPSSRGLGRHPFKVEIRGSNPLGGTSTPAEPDGLAPLLPSVAMEIMGIEIRTIVKDNVAIRCDGCLEVIDGTPWRVNLLDIVASEAPVAWTERPTINPGPFQFHRDASHVRRWMAGKGFLFCRRGEVREIMRPVRIPTDPPRWGLCDGIHRDDHEFVPA